MSPIVRNILAVIAGFIVGSIVNMGLIIIGPQIIPPPEGVDPTNMESILANIHRFEPKHFIFPFLAHAIGTLAGAYTTARIAVFHKIRYALVVGVLFLAAGIYNTFLIPAPTWFNVLDLVVAYIPMAWIGGKLGSN